MEAVGDTVGVADGGAALSVAVAVLVAAAAEEALGTATEEALATTGADDALTAAAEDALAMAADDAVGANDGEAGTGAATTTTVGSRDMNA